MRHAIKNGVLIGEDQAVLPVTSRAVQYAYSIYESLRIKKGSFVHLDEHLERLRNSAKGIKLEIGHTDLEIKKWLRDLSEADHLVDETFRVLVVGDRPATVIITHFPTGTYPAEWYEKGVEVTTFEGERYLPNFKTSNLLVSYLALTDAEEKGCFEALLVDRNGCVTEGTRSNFYGIKGNTVYSAPKKDILHGVTMMGLMKALDEMGLEMVFRPIPVDTLFDYDSIFITSTGWKALPISKVDGRPCRHDAEDKVLELSRLIGEWE